MALGGVFGFGRGEHSIEIDAAAYGSFTRRCGGLLGYHAHLGQRLARSKFADEASRRQIELPREQLHPRPLRVVEPFDAAGKNEVIGRAGRGHIQQPIQFGGIFARSVNRHNSKPLGAGAGAPRYFAALVSAA